MSKPTANPTAAVLERRFIRRIKALYRRNGIEPDAGYFTYYALDAMNDHPRTTGADPARIFTRATKLLRSHGWKVSVHAMPADHPDALGYSDPEHMSVRIRPGMDPAQRAQTILHEIAHIVMGHTSNEWYAVQPNAFEVEAEGISYVVAGLQGLDTSDESIGYAAGWAEGQIGRIVDPQRIIEGAQALSDELDRIEA